MNIASSSGGAGHLRGSCSRPLVPDANTRLPRLVGFQGCGRERSRARSAGRQIQSRGTRLANPGVRAELHLLKPTPTGSNSRAGPVAPPGVQPPLLIYLPGADGTGNAIRSQIPTLYAAGFDVRSLYVPADDRSDWDSLTNQTVDLLRASLGDALPRREVVLVGESFGACLALRVAVAVPGLLRRLILINPGTSFARSFLGIPDLLVQSRLLSVFPEGLYQVVQSVVLSLLVERRQVEAEARASLKKMTTMTPPPASKEEEMIPESGQRLSWGSSLVPHTPSANASWRLELLRAGDLPDSVISRIELKSLVIASAKDRLLPSIEESVRLLRLMPRSQRIILPDSGHTPLLEGDVCLANVLAKAGYSPRVRMAQAAQRGAVAKGPAATPAAPQSTSAPPAVAKGPATRSPQGPQVQPDVLFTAAELNGGATSETDPRTPDAEGSGESRGNVWESDDEGDFEETGPRPSMIISNGGLLDTPFMPPSGPACMLPPRDAAGVANGAQTTSGPGFGSPNGDVNGGGTGWTPADGDGGRGLAFQNGAQDGFQGGYDNAMFATQEEDDADLPNLIISNGGFMDTPFVPPRMPVQLRNGFRGNGAAQLPPQADEVQDGAGQLEAGVFIATEDDELDASVPRPNMVIHNGGPADTPSALLPTSPGQLPDPQFGVEPPSPASLPPQKGSTPTNGAPSPANNVNPTIGVVASAAAGALQSPLSASAETSASNAMANGAASTQLPTAGATRGAGSTARPAGSAGATRGAGDGGGKAGAEKAPLPPENCAMWSPIDEQFEEGVRLWQPLRSMLSPVVRGWRLLPQPSGPRRPLLFVGNHTLYGLYDMPSMIGELYLRGYKVRGLAHPGHWNGPLGAIFERFGATQASPFTLYKLLSSNEAVLLYPGGAREVNKRKGEEYQLKWRQKAQFVDMARKFNAIIIPFAAVGGDDAFKLALDSQEILENPVLGPLTRAAFGRLAPGLDPNEVVPPVSTLPGLGLPSLLPFPNGTRIYFRFMEPVDTQTLCDSKEDSEAAYALIQDRIAAGISNLQAEQAADPYRDFLPRMQALADDILPEEVVDARRGLQRQVKAETRLMQERLKERLAAVGITLPWL